MGYFSSFLSGYYHFYPVAIIHVCHWSREHRNPLQAITHPTLTVTHRASGDRRRKAQHPRVCRVPQVEAAAPTAPSTPEAQCKDPDQRGDCQGDGSLIS